MSQYPVLYVEDNADDVLLLRHAFKRADILDPVQFAQEFSAFARLYCALAVNTKTIRLATCRVVDKCGQFQKAPYPFRHKCLFSKH